MIPKYRAWLKADKEMISVEEIAFDTKWVRSFYKLTSRWFKLEEVELMQSTGLCDKEGTEVFEGDIVRQVRTQPTTENKTITGVVTMLEGAWVIMNDCEQLASYLWSETDENEVLGNIYENQELLENKGG